jgi:Na+/H+-dicarboxylate symporter
MLIVPLIFSVLVVGVSSFTREKLGRMFGKTFFFYYFTGLCAICIGLIVASVSGLGMGMELGELKKMAVKQAPPFKDVLLNIVPKNPIKALAEGNVLQIIFFAIVFGMSIGAAGRAAEPVRAFFEGVAEVMYKLVGYVLWYGPIGVFALMAWTVYRDVWAFNTKALRIPYYPCLHIDSHHGVFRIWGATQGLWRSALPLFQ